MSELLLAPTIYIGTMVLSFVLKKVGILRSENRPLLTSILLYVTLPAAIVTSFEGFEIDSWLLKAFLIGILINVFGIVAAVVLTHRKDRKTRSLYMLTGCGHNLGTSGGLSFLKLYYPGGIPYLMSYDIADTIVLIINTYSIFSEGDQSGLSGKIKATFRAMITSPYFIASVVGCALALFRITLPVTIKAFLDFLGSSNAFLAMMLVGLLIDVDSNTSSLRRLPGLLVFRIVISILCSIGVILLFPDAPAVMKKILIGDFFVGIGNTPVILYEQKYHESSDLSLLFAVDCVITVPLLSIICPLLETIL